MAGTLRDGKPMLQTLRVFKSWFLSHIITIIIVVVLVGSMIGMIVTGLAVDKSLTGPHTRFTLNPGKIYNVTVCSDPDEHTNATPGTISTIALIFKPENVTTLEWYYGKDNNGFWFSALPAPNENATYPIVEIPREDGTKIVYNDSTVKVCVSSTNQTLTRFAFPESHRNATLIPTDDSTFTVLYEDWSESITIQAQEFRVLTTTSYIDGSFAFFYSVFVFVIGFIIWYELQKG